MGHVVRVRVSVRVILMVRVRVGGIVGAIVRVRIGVPGPDRMMGHMVPFWSRNEGVASLVRKVTLVTHVAPL